MKKEEIGRFICQELPRHHLQNMLASIEAAFSKSDRQLKDSYQKVPLMGPGPQSHHYMVQEALLNLPFDDTFEVVNYPTQPAGGHFALIRAGDLQITTSVITVGRKPPIRDAAFRRSLSETNKRLEREHPDLFRPCASSLGPSQDSLHALILPHTVKWTESDHSSPIGIVVAVPYSNPKAGFHFLEEVDQLWQYYDEADGGLEDIAYPALRDRMRRAEKGDQNEAG